jgi:phosphatidylglycerophosphatase A
LFRIFDITKPFPASYADKKMKNALGVILDDVFAGLYGMIILYIIMILLKGF